MNAEVKIAIIILAAGSSSRMGESKQLLPVQNEPLLRRIARTASTVNPSSLIVVLGSQREAHEKVLYDLPITVVHNPKWETGMGSSLKAGIQALQSQRDNSNAAIILLCDQPHVSSEYILLLIDRYKSSGRSIIASYYSGTAGVPVLFDESLFSEVLKLQDEEGAKKLLKQYPRHIEYVDFPAGSIDLDTPSDYQFYLKNLPD